MTKRLITDLRWCATRDHRDYTISISPREARMILKELNVSVESDADKARKKRGRGD